MRKLTMSMMMMMSFWVWYKLQDFGTKPQGVPSTSTCTLTFTPTKTSTATPYFTVTVQKLAIATLTPDSTPKATLPTIVVTPGGGG